MEASGGFIQTTLENTGLGDTGLDSPSLADNALNSGVLDAICANLRDMSGSAASEAATFSFHEATGFAATIEEISRTLDYLQLVAAGAVDRTRRQSSIQIAKAVASGGSSSWATGWHDQPDAGKFSDGMLASPATASPAPVSCEPAPGATAGATAVDDGYRNTVEFLRARLRISAAEARRRLALSEDLLPRTSIAGLPMPARREELGAAMAAATVSSRSASIITLALDRVQAVADSESLARMEDALTRTAAESDPDFLTRIARRWADAIDQDGAEPTEELLRQVQGAFIRKARRGLHHLEIFATPDQFEHLITAMNTATNPRNQVEGPASGSGTSTADHDAAEQNAAELDLRSRPQKLLDGLVGACKVALASGTLPAAGGLRPQVMVTIDYRDLLSRLLTASPLTASGGCTEPDQTGSMLFGGPINATTIRKLACDADIIPVVLGGEGRILDIGRASRVFPPHIRKAIMARDQGCAFPGCTIPAPWCEAHHISYWSQGGTTGTGNGTLLCSHHHHLIHKEQWTIHVRDGIPWFIPPPHIDPHQKPRRNHYFRPPARIPAA